MSDITANLIKENLIEYTQSICEKHNIPMEEFHVKKVYYDFVKGCWNNKIVSLPRHPLSSDANKLPILLVPLRILNDLPSLNYRKKFQRYRDSKSLRKELSREIGINLEADDLIKTAKHAQLIAQIFLKKIKESRINSYDIKKDYKGVYSWYENNKTYFLHNNILDFSNLSNPECGYKVAEQFKNFLESDQGVHFLKTDEVALQRLFDAIIEMHFEKNQKSLLMNIDGIGKIDNKPAFFIKIKNARRSSYWSYFEKNLAPLLTKATTKNGVFIIICAKDEDFKKAHEIQDRIQKVELETKSRLKTVIIDARVGIPK